MTHELKQHPSVSYGNHLDDHDLVVINVNEGDFKGTIFNYANIDFPEGENDQLVYSTDFQLFCYQGTYFDEKPAEEVLGRFHNEVSSPIIHNMLIAAVEQEKETKEQQSAE